MSTSPETSRTFGYAGTPSIVAADGCTAARLPGKAARDEVVQNLGANLAALPIGADHGKASRLEERLHRGRGGGLRAFSRPLLKPRGRSKREDDVHDAGIEAACDLEAGVEEDAHHRLVGREDEGIERLQIVAPPDFRQNFEHSGADSPALQPIRNRKRDLGVLRMRGIALVAGDGAKPAREFRDQDVFVRPIGAHQARDFARLWSSGS